MNIKNLVVPIVTILIGIILLLVPGEIITTIIRIIGALIIAGATLSIIDIIKNKKQNLELMYSILIGILGIIFISNPEVIAGIIPLLLGLFIILKSAVKLRLVYSLKQDGTDYWIKPLIVNILMLILGLVLVFNPFRGAEALIMIIAIFMISYGILDIIEIFMTKPKRVKVLK